MSRDDSEFEVEPAFTAKQAPMTVVLDPSQDATAAKAEQTPTPEHDSEPESGQVAKPERRNPFQVPAARFRNALISGDTFDVAPLKELPDGAELHRLRVEVMKRSTTWLSQVCGVPGIIIDEVEGGRCDLAQAASEPPFFGRREVLTLFAIALDHERANRTAASQE